MTSNTARKSRRNIFSGKGFTLIEVVMTVAILAFGIVSIYETFFVSIDVYGYYTHYLSTQNWMSEKIWTLQEELTRSRVLDEDETFGEMTRDHKIFHWVMRVSKINQQQALYQVSIKLSWKEGGKEVSTSRETYILPLELKTYDEESSA
mgnify:CR=1 FL=1